MSDLARREWDMAVSVAYQRVGDPDDAEDIVQEAFARMWATRRTWKDPERLRGLLLRTVHNLANNTQRDRQNRLRLLESSPVRGPSPATPVDEMFGREAWQRLVQAIDGLPEQQRRVFTLCEFEGVSCEEVADRFGISQQTAANHLSRARGALMAQVLPKSTGERSRALHFRRGPTTGAYRTP